MLNASYIFSILLILYIIISCNKSKFLGLSRSTYGISLYWILLFASYIMFITPYWGYNNVYDLMIIGLGILLLSSSKCNIEVWSGTTKLYILFLFWCLLSIIYAVSIVKAILMLLLLFEPIVYYAFSRVAFKTSDSIWCFIDRISSLSILYLLATVIDVFSDDFFYVYPYFGMYVFPCALAMYLRTRKKKYLLFCILCLSANLAEVKRTPMLGMILSLSLMFIFKYRVKAIFLIPFLLTGFILAIFYVPAIRNYMFFEGFDPSVVDWNDLISGETLEMVNTHGRDSMWDFIFNKFYLSNVWIGSGLATVKTWLQSSANDSGSFDLLHNDWLEILCETGRIGIALLVSFYLRLVYSAYREYSATTNKDMKYLKSATIIQYTIKGRFMSR